MTDRSLKIRLKNENGLSLNGTLEIEINPPGQLSSEIDFVDWMIAAKVNMNDHCNQVNQSVFDAAKLSAGALVNLLFYSGGFAFV